MYLMGLQAEVEQGGLVGVREGLGAHTILAQNHDLKVVRQPQGAQHELRVGTRGVGHLAGGRAVGRSAGRSLGCWQCG